MVEGLFQVFVEVAEEDFYQDMDVSMPRGHNIFRYFKDSIIFFNLIHVVLIILPFVLTLVQLWQPNLLNMVRL